MSFFAKPSTVSDFVTALEFAGSFEQLRKALSKFNLVDSENQHVWYDFNDLKRKAENNTARFTVSEFNDGNTAHETILIVDMVGLENKADVICRLLDSEVYCNAYSGTITTVTESLRAEDGLIDPDMFMKYVDYLEERRQLRAILEDQEGL